MTSATMASQELPRKPARRRSQVQSAFALHSRNLSRRVAVGAGFQVLGIVMRTVLTIASTAILARLLVPADFGYVAMATVVTEFAALLGAFGFTSVLIQRRNISRLQLDTVFWATTAIGVALALIVLLLSFGTGWLFADPMVGQLLRLLCLAFVFNSLAAVPGTVIARLMHFRAEFWIRMGSTLAGSAVAVGSALVGLGVWSLALGAVAGAFTTLVLSFVFAPYAPRRRFHLPLLTTTWRTSSSYLGNSLLYYVNTNLDLLLIGRHLGATSLGFYQNARSLTDEIRARIAMPLQHVLFPAFSALQSQPQQFRELVVRAGRWLAAVVIPIGVGVSANAPELVRVLYGNQWEPMVPVMSVFGLSAALRAATAISSPLFSANDRVAQGLRYNLLATFVMVGGVLVAMPYGIVAVAAAAALNSLVSFAACRAAFELIGLRLKAVLQMLGPPMVASLALWLATAASRHVEWHARPGVLLAGHVTLGAAVYLCVLCLLSPRYLLDLRAAASRFLRRS